MITHIEYLQKYKLESDHWMHGSSCFVLGDGGKLVKQKKVC